MVISGRVGVGGVSSERDEYTALHSPGFEATLLITNSSPMVSYYNNNEVFIRSQILSDRNILSAHAYIHTDTDNEQGLDSSVRGENMAVCCFGKRNPTMNILVNLFFFKQHPCQTA